jgi:hypothetical protein
VNFKRACFKYSSLEEALKYTPGSEIILYFKALWKYQQALIEKDLEQKSDLLPALKGKAFSCN